ncbi:hypothetical protein BGZ50_002430 [Haplosporangium sp. Z 11]|nr:hypothetical protein BGZ50_002430 [Haplosporangium sp. Z 11]
MLQTRMESEYWAFQSIENYKAYKAIAAYGLGDDFDGLNWGSTAQQTARNTRLFPRGAGPTLWSAGEPVFSMRPPPAASGLPARAAATSPASTADSIEPHSPESYADTSLAEFNSPPREDGTSSLAFILGLTFGICGS